MNGMFLEGSQTGAGLPGTTLVWIFWIACGFLILVLQIFIAIWMYKDARASGKSGAWAAFGWFPILGLFALFAYLLSRGGGAPVCPKHNQPVSPATGRCFLCEQESMPFPAPRSAGGKIEPQTATVTGGAVGGVAIGGQLPLNPLGGGRRVAPTIVEGMSDPQSVPLILLTYANGTRRGHTEQLPMEDGKRPLVHKIGRDPACKVVITEDGKVSAEHAQVGKGADGTYFVADLHAANGTFLLRKGANGQDERHDLRTVRDMTLQKGDILELGSTHLEVNILEPPKEE